MKNLHRIALVASVVAGLGAGVACGGSGGSVSPTAEVAAPSVAAPRTPLATETAAPATPTTAAGEASATPAAPAATAPASQATVPPAPPTTAPPPPPPAVEQALTIVAKNVKFSPSALTARAGGVLHLTLDNQDAGVQHDIILYDASGAVAGATDPAMGPVRQALTVTLGAPQRYTFKCSVHPQAMNGALAVQ